MKKDAYSKIEVVVVLAGLAILAAVLMPMFERTRIRERQTEDKTCQSNLKQMALGIKQYVQDYDELHPIISSGKYGWMEILFPYLRNKQLFQCPSDANGNVIDTSDYFYNARLAAVSEAKLDHIANTIMNGDGEGNAVTNVHLSELPFNWLSDPNSPSFRHDGTDANGEQAEGAMYSYADGHVKFLTPAQVRVESPAKAPTLSTFAVK